MSITHPGRRLLIAAACLCASASAHAAFDINVGTDTCTGTRTTDTTSEANTVILSCTGDFNLGDGSIHADGKLVLRATGNLSLLGHLDVSANALVMEADHAILADATILSTNTAPTLVSNSAPSIAAGSSLSINGSAPGRIGVEHIGGSVALVSNSGAITVAPDTTQQTSQGGGGAFSPLMLLGSLLLALWLSVTRRRRAG